MYLLYCVHLFLIPMGLSPVSLCFGTAGVVTRCFLTSWGRCFEEGVEKLAIMFSCSFPLLLSDSFLSAMFSSSSLSYLNFIFVWSPLPIYLPYQCQLWRPRLTSLQTEDLKDEEEEVEKGGYLSGWSLQKTALPTWTDCFSRSTAGTHTDRQTDNRVHAPHIYSKSCSGSRLHEKLCFSRLHYARQISQNPAL